MPEQTIQTINAMLNEEKWTRATLNDYAVGNFKELDEVIETVSSEGIQKEVQELCEEHLKNAKNSIVALYIGGLISLSKQQVDDAHLHNLISIFVDNHKWTAVEYLCERILGYRENKDALRTLAETLEHLGENERMYDTLERLIKVDLSEADVVRRLAEKKEADGHTDDAILYYRKALHRFVNRNLVAKVKDVWKKLVELGVDDYEFFFLIEKRIAKTMHTERVVELLEELYPAIKEREEWPAAIKILKKILSYDSANNWARQEIIECYRMQYASHSQIEECLRLSNLNHNWRNVLEAIADFEKHISFDSGNFVFHKTWGVGVIKGLSGDTITIDFTKKRKHSMSLKMAVSALQSLTQEHIWVLKSIYPKDKIRVKVKKDIPWALKTIIRSFDNVADMKKIKAELVPSLLSASEWTSWSPEARRILKTDPEFGNVPDKLELFIMRDNPMTFEEKTSNQFKAAKNISGKIQTVRDFLLHSNPDSEFFAEMFDYFTAFLNSGNLSVQVVMSYLFIRELTDAYPFLNPGLDWGFKDLWADIENPLEIFSQIDDEALRNRFLSEVHNEIEEWPEVYLRLFPIQLSGKMLEELVNAGFKDKVLGKLEEILEHYREYRDGLIWIARNREKSDWLLEIGLSEEKIFINMIRLLSLTFTDIRAKREVILNRKLNRQIQRYLFKEEHLQTFILSGDKNSALRLFTLLDDVEDVDPVIKRDLKSTIQQKFPKITFYGEKQSSEPSVLSRSRHFYALKSSLSAKKKELKQIIEVEIPKNSKEIGAAIELGDLSENAEYKAGKEHQENLQIQVGRIKDEIERARLYSAEELKEDRISFGTRITLDDLVNGKQEVYSILGPWESNPSEGIISYLSPFGHAFIGKSLGDLLEFDINNRSYRFTVKAVEMLDLDV